MTGEIRTRRLDSNHAGLGRHVEHDPRSKRYPARGLAGAPKSRIWNHDAPVLDQGSVGSCTGTALSQLLNCSVMQLARRAGQEGPNDNRYLDQDDALRLYAAATRLDSFDGDYPPDDTGSSGLAIAKAAQAEGFLTGYTHVFGLTMFLQTIALHPIIVGTDWYGSFDDPGKRGLVEIVGNEEPVGGHEYLCLGVDHDRQEFVFLQSWGPEWPTRKLKGRFRMSFATFGRLLYQDGDATVPIGAVPQSMNPEAVSSA